MDLMTFIENNWFSLTLLVSVAGGAWRLATKVDNMKDDINKKFDELEYRIKESEQYRTDDKEREKLIMQGVEATLRTLHSQGANGPVTESLNAIDKYKSDKAVG